jgi:glutamine amidotransferase
MIAIIDYGAGNIKSLKNALDYLKIDNVLTNNIDEIKQSDKIILPGVGAFPSAMEKLNKSGLSELIKIESQKKPLLGICLGMQLLFDKSFEFSECNGLSLINGKVDLIPSDNLIIPHMGWNKLVINHNNRLLNDVEDEYVYFVHSYQAYCDKDENLISYCQYGNLKIPAVVHDGNYVYGTQFHPEKSGDVGLKILQNFGEI